jgi:hypothetical protein
LIDDLSPAALKAILEDEDSDFHALAYAPGSGFASLSGFEACRLHKKDLLQHVPDLTDALANKILHFLKRTAWPQE